jgi:Protein of unknown function (DUF1320)
MSTFITYNDYQARLSQRILSLLTDNDNLILDNAEIEAAGIITDRLADKFDLNAEFVKTGSGRNATLLRWMKSLSLYFVYARVPDEEVPERIIKDYDDTRTELEKIQGGKLGCSLKRLTDSEGETITRFRMGSNTPRSHDPFGEGEEAVLE